MPNIIVEYIAKTDQLTAASAKVNAANTSVGKAARKAFVPAAAGLALVAVGTKKAIDAASGLNEQISASTIVFGDHAKGMQDWSKTGAEAFGLSRRETLEAANAYGNMFNTVGLGAKDVATMSRSMVGLAGDMASFHDQDPTEMLERLRGGLAGEAEPLRRFGVLLSEAAVKQEAYRLGIAKTGEPLTEAQKVQARYALIMEQTASAQGDFARTSDSVANKQRSATAATENAAATLGQALLPVTSTLIGMLTSVVGFLAKYPGLIQILVGAFVALAAAIVILNIALTVTAVVTSPITIWFVLAAALVVALIAVIVLLARNWDTVVDTLKRGFEAVKAAANSVLTWLRANWPLIVAILAGPLAVAVLLLIRHWDQVRNAAQTVANFIRGVWQALVGFFQGVVSSIGAALGRLASWFDRPGDAARDMLATIKTAVSAIADFISGQVGRVAAAVARIVAAIKTPINAVLGAWNAITFSIPHISLPGVSVKGKQIVPPVDFGGQSFGVPRIPLLARGGVVDRPTLLVAGEAGREIIAPESLLRSLVGAPQVRVFIGDRELRDLVRVEVVRQDNRTAQTLLAGAR